MMNQNLVWCNICYQSTTQLFQVPGYQLPTCAKCSENLTKNPAAGPTTTAQQSVQPNQQYYVQQQNQQQQQVSPAPPPQQQQQSLHCAPTAMPPPPLTSAIPNSVQHHQHQGAPTAHHKKFTSTTATNSFPNTFELEQALMNMDGEILLGEEGKCPLCQKIFNRKTSLLNHIRNHSADKKYVCPYCQKGFSQQANLRNHERIHTNDRPYTCADCGKAFTQITNLNNHRRLHTGERPFVCIEPNCGRSFAQVTNLNNHMKTHHKIQQFVCTQCPRKFHTVTQLNHHLATHGIVVKPQMAARGDYICNMCPASFFDEPQLKRHIQKHIEGRVIPCTIIGCGESFSTKNQLNKHLQNQHPHEYQKKKESRHVPLSLLQLPGSPHYNSIKTKIKIEEDIRIPAASHISQIPIQIASHINLPPSYQQGSFNSDSLMSNDATKKVLSITEIINCRVKN
ncbi:zinc finger protein 501-like isoform X3 [Chironomus tepperi]|uniref:zinc finger protein 501-like isoform X3 n=1 Tax=Chironomus tepperi TaxID=113505 RepID=UPI00391EFF4F